MSPTLQINDYFYISKLHLRAPARPGAREILVFRQPCQPQVDFIKRWSPSSATPSRSGAACCTSTAPRCRPRCIRTRIATSSSSSSSTARRSRREVSRYRRPSAITPSRCSTTSSCPRAPSSNEPAPPRISASERTSQGSRARLWRQLRPGGRGRRPAPAARPGCVKTGTARLQRVQATAALRGPRGPCLRDRQSPQLERLAGLGLRTRRGPRQGPRHRHLVPVRPRPRPRRVTRRRCARSRGRGRAAPAGSSRARADAPACASRKSRRSRSPRQPRAIRIWATAPPQAVAQAPAAPPRGARVSAERGDDRPLEVERLDDLQPVTHKE